MEEPEVQHPEVLPIQRARLVPRLAKVETVLTAGQEELLVAPLEMEMLVRPQPAAEAVRTPLLAVVMK